MSNVSTTSDRDLNILYACALEKENEALKRELRHLRRRITWLWLKYRAEQIEKKLHA
jgi:hypothetical protein